MKRTLLNLCLIVSAYAGKAQNLVPNGDFEQYSPCPPSYGYLTSATSWFNPATLTPDYFNVCAGTAGLGAGVPGNAFGYQSPHSGDGYAGIYGCQSPYVNVREYACAQLTQPLTAGTAYLVQYYVNLSGACRYAVVNYGAYLSPSSSVNLNGYLINAVPQIENTVSLLTDTTGWMLISGTFVASGGEQYIIIGSFKDDSSCGLQEVNPVAASIAYYFIDDVSVTEATSIEEQNLAEQIKIYPNPVGEELKISGLNLLAEKNAEIKITDASGREIYRNQLPTSDFQLPMSSFQKGIYFLEIYDGKNNVRKKFIKE